MLLHTPEFIIIKIAFESKPKTFLQERENEKIIEIYRQIARASHKAIKFRNFIIVNWPLPLRTSDRYTSLIANYWLVNLMCSFKTVNLYHI